MIRGEKYGREEGRIAGFIYKSTRRMINRKVQGSGSNIRRGHDDVTNISTNTSWQISNIDQVNIAVSALCLRSSRARIINSVSIDFLGFFFFSGSIILDNYIPWRNSYSSFNRLLHFLVNLG